MTCRIIDDTTGGTVERTIEYHGLFDRRDREEYSGQRGRHLNDVAEKVGGRGS